jgi:hypothetical protein
MAGTTPRTPEQFLSASLPIDFTVSELVSDSPGSHSPFGETEFPLPVDKLLYKHPAPNNRPHLADGR